MVQKAKEERDTIPSISDTRKKRYMTKILHGRNRMDLARDWVMEDTSRGNIKTILALSKAFQEAAEACVDLLAMLLRDSSVPPRDDYTNIRTAIEATLISDDIGAVLREANGLGNRLIHVYNDIDTGILFESISRVLPGLTTFLEVVETWIDEA